MFSNLQRLVCGVFIVAALACLQPAAEARADARAEAYNAGLGYFLRGDHAAAIASLTRAAIPGEPWRGEFETIYPQTTHDYAANASCLLGDIHAMGLGTEADMRAAGKWWFPPEKKHDELLAAAEKGDTAAQVALGDLYVGLPCRMHVEKAGVIVSNGTFLPGLAVDWYAKAAARGDAQAALKAGKILGSKYEQTPDEKLKLQGFYRVAAESGLAEGQHRYGMALRDAGEFAEGLRWLRKAEAQGYAPAKKYLEEGRAYEIRVDGRYEMVFMLAIFALITIALFAFLKKKPLRDYLTWRYAGKVLVYLGIFAAALYTIASTPELSRVFDRIFMLIMRARLYLPDAIADNTYLFVTAVYVALVAFVLLVAQFKQVFIVTILRTMDTEPDKGKKPDKGGQE